jgi:hypothetical protein
MKDQQRWGFANFIRSDVPFDSEPKAIDNCDQLAA